MLNCKCSLLIHFSAGSFHFEAFNPVLDKQLQLIAHKGYVETFAFTRLSVQKFGRTNKCPPGRAPDASAGERWRSLQRVLQSAPPACGGGILQLTDTATPQRLVKTIYSQSYINQLFRCFKTAVVVLFLKFCSIQITDSLNPLTIPQINPQRNVLNDRGNATPM